MDAYDTVLARWSGRVTGVEVPTPFGPTRALLSGPAAGPPLVLLPGGGATPAVWFAVAGVLGRAVVCVDLPGGTGRTSADLATWLDAVLAGLELDVVDLGGHSYGGWVALRYALDRPERVRRLALLDPTRCFTGMSPGYLVHALAPLLRPSPARWGAFLDWETGGRGLDPDWREIVVHQGRSSVAVQPRRPTAAELGALELPVLVLAAELSRQHDVRALAAGAQALPDVRVRTLPGVSHHQVPSERPDQLVAELRAFLD